MKSLLSLAVVAAAFFQTFAQSVNLQDQYNQGQISVINRELNAYGEDAITMNAAEGDGLGLLSDPAFETGTIELEIKGENAPGRSFVGFAFNIQNDSTYEAIYFRPFNFVAEAPARRSHMMQYIFHPEYPWHVLRKERTDEFEAELPSPPGPDDWFKARIEITENTVSVYVDNRTEAVLEVKRLTSTSSSKIGLWAGHRSSGWYRNLTVTTAE
jgi:hypothetical protein